MDNDRFDQLARSVSSVVTRRALLLLGELSGTALALPLPSVGRKHKKRKKHKPHRKPTFNAFGCVDIAGFCQHGKQCCSGLCQGKKDRKTCRPHDQSTCQVGQTRVQCGGAENVPCTTSNGEPRGLCHTTTGNSAICATFANCTACRKDADCRDLCGLQSACVPCVICASGTACVGVDFTICDPRAMVDGPIADTPKADS
jgi:hypothetical protein